jgi:hypothetical protein
MGLTNKRDWTRDDVAHLIVYLHNNGVEVYSYSGPDLRGAYNFITSDAAKATTLIAEFEAKRV